LGLSIRVSMFEHVDWWLGPLPRSPGMGEGGDWWSWPMGVVAKGILRGCQGLFTPVSLGYPLSVFNKNSTLKLLFWKQKRTIGSHTNKKILLSHDSPWFFPSFLFFNETFFLKFTRTAWHGFSYRKYSTVVFAFWRGLCVVKGMEWLCIQFLKCNTGVIFSQSTSTWQPLCTRCVLPVGWSCWLHSTRWMYHRTVSMVNTSLQSAGVCLWGSWFFGTRLWWHSIHLPGFQLWGTLSVSHYHRRASTSWALQSLPEYSSGTSASRGYKMPSAPNTNPEITFVQSVYQSIRMECRRTSWKHHGPLIDY